MPLAFMLKVNDNVTYLYPLVGIFLMNFQVWFLLCCSSLKEALFITPLLST